MCVCAKWHYSCLTLCDPKDFSPPDSSICGMFQALVPECVSMSSSKIIYLYKILFCYKHSILGGQNYKYFTNERMKPNFYSKFVV